MKVKELREVFDDCWFEVSYETDEDGNDIFLKEENGEITDEIWEKEVFSAGGCVDDMVTTIYVYCK